MQSRKPEPETDESAVATEPTARSPRRGRKILQHIIEAPILVVAAIYEVLDRILLPLLRPALRALAGWRLFAAMAAAIRRLAPYPSLILLGIPLVVIEPLKIVAIYWGATGHPKAGLALLVGAQLFSILCTERIFSIALPKLLQIPWFALIWQWFVTIRDKAFAYLRATPAWQACLAGMERIRTVLARAGSYLVSRMRGEP